MVASIFSCSFAFLILVSFVRVAHTTNCGNKCTEYLPGLFIYFDPTRVVKTFNDANIFCQNLDIEGRSWHLPKLDTVKKNIKFTEAIRQKATGFVWIGLIRDEANPKDWKDPSKWRWTSDNTRLDESFVNENPPWGTGEPNNIGNERCAMITHIPSSAWNDLNCGTRLYNFLSVCESEMPTTTTTTTIATTTPTTTTSTATATVPTTTTTTTTVSTTTPEPTIIPTTSTSVSTLTSTVPSSPSLSILTSSKTGTDLKSTSHPSQSTNANAFTTSSGHKESELWKILLIGGFVLALIIIISVAIAIVIAVVIINSMKSSNRQIECLGLKSMI